MGAIQSGTHASTSLEAFHKFVREIEWLKRKFVDVTVSSNVNDRAWALADDLGAIALVLPAGRQTAGSISIPMRRDGNYAYKWRDISTGEELATGESRASSNKITIPVPSSEFGVVCNVVRK